MVFYKYYTDSSFAAYKVPDDEQRRYLKAFARGRPETQDFRLVHLDDEEKEFPDRHYPDPDFARVLTTTDPFVTPRAWEVLQPLLGDSVVTFPCMHRRGFKLFSLCVRERVPFIDRDRCETMISPLTRKPFAVKRYALHEELIRGRHLVRSTHGQIDLVLFSQEFRDLVVAHGLTGLCFHPLPQVGDPPDPKAASDGAAENKEASPVIVNSTARSAPPVSPTTPEDILSQWLADPLEFGCPPKSVRLLHTYHVSIKHRGPTDVHLLRYEMPNGAIGRGFVNPTTWSFQGDKVNQIPDDDLLLAYMGWLYVFPTLQNGHLVPITTSEGEEQRLLEKKANAGFTEVVILERYQLLQSIELFEWRAQYQGEPVRGAGNSSNIDLWHPASHPRYHLPALYYLFGPSMMVSPPSAAATPAQG